MGEWRSMSLREAGVALIDCVHKTPAAVEDGYPYITIPQMKNGRIDFSTARRISSTDFIEWTKKARPQIHDVVLSRRTNPGVTATFGKHCQFALGQNLVLLRANGRFVRPEFLRWLVVSPSWWSQIEKYNNVGAVFDSLRCADVPRFELPIPSLRDQEAIASILGALGDKINLNRLMNETLEAMARAMFKDWFVDFGPTRAKMEGRAPYVASDLWSLFPDLLDNEGKPQGWEWGTLGDIARPQSQSVKPNQVSPDTPYIGLEHMPRRSLVLDTWEGAGKVTSGKFSFRHGDVLFGKLRPYFHKVGIAPLDGICSTDIVVLSAKEKADSTFVICCVSSDEFVAYTNLTSVGTKMPRTTWELMRRYSLCLPPVRLRQAFQSAAEPLFEKIVSSIPETRDLAATRDLLLPKLMSGEIRVRDAEKIAEAAQ